MELLKKKIKVTNPNKHLLIADKTRYVETRCDSTQSKLCWWCCHPGSLSTYGITTGSFCSPNCALAFCQDNDRDTEEISMIHFEFMRQCDIQLIPAPSRYILEDFGGNVSIADYRANFAKTKGCGRSEYIITRVIL
jgi:hypothetical protein